MSGDGAGDSLTGRTVGNWQLLRQLGEGAFGGVYEAQNVSIAGRRAAVKILHAHMSFNADIKRRFVNEASAASRADHENIVQVFDGGVTPDGLCYVVMEMLKGASLAGVLRGGRISVERTIHFGAQIAGALEAAHALGIVHRDLKPDNVFVTQRAGGQEFIKVLDFGIAKLRSDGDGVKTKTGMWLGTPAYMSPEQWQTLPDLDGRSDIYALGVILFECLTGLLPFSASNPFEWLNAHLTQAPPDVATLAPVPPRLAALVQRMLAKSRDERPSTMLEVQGELQTAQALAVSAPSAATMHPSPSRPMDVVHATPSPFAATPYPSAAMPHGLAASPHAPSTPSAAATPQPFAASQQGGAVATRARPLAATLPGQVPAPARSPLPLLAIVGAVALGVGAGGFALFGRGGSKPGEAATDGAKSGRAATAASHAEAPAGTVAIAGGALRMGRAEGGRAEALDAPPHDVAVGDFALEVDEVTVARYAEAVRAGVVEAPWPPGIDLARVGELPVIHVPFEDAVAYCRFRYPKRGRLPTEAEWEMAARAGDGRLYPFGESFRADCVNAMAGEAGRVAPPGARACGATPTGIRDLAGNAAEWTSTPAMLYPGARPTGAEIAGHVVRGGSFASASPDEVTATARRFQTAPDRFTGFRCAVDLASPAP